MSSRPMKDSGIPWIGEIPADWEVTQLRRLVDPRRPITYGIVLPGENVDDGVFIIKSGDCTAERLNPARLHRTTRLIEASYVRSRMKANDLVISIRGTVGLVARLPASLDGANLTQDTARIAPHAEVHSGWLLHVMGSSPMQTGIDVETVGATVRGLNLRELRRLRVPRPKLEEQQRISMFLDARTSSVNAAIAKHEHTLTLLMERRRTLVSHSVTRGLDPNALMRDSGIPWIGAIPAHWRAVRIVRVARLESGHTPSRQVPDYWKPAECTIPWFTLADVWQLREGLQEYLGDTAEKVSPAGIANSSARVLPEGTVVLSRTASVGYSGIMPRPMATTQDFANWVCGPSLTPEYLLFVLRSMAREFERMKQGSTHQTIYMPDLKKLAIPLPPLDEQRAIVAHLRARTSVIDEAAETARRAIALLREYRQSLVTAAVTGRVDVEAAS